MSAIESYPTSFDSRDEDRIMQEEMMRSAVAKKKQEDYERLQILGGKLSTLANENAAKRKHVEDRWVEDLRQYHGKYPPSTLSAIQAVGGSEVFVNITRPKADTFSARMADMLLPTDDVNWGIEPTPVPELAGAKNDPTVLKTPEGKTVVSDQQQPVQAQDMAKGIEKAIEEACKKMYDEMSDQLQEAGYNGVQRDVIEDMSVYGTGVLKGPVIVGNTRRAWIYDPTTKTHTIKIIEDRKPAAVRVSIWDFFPDMSATRIQDAEYIFERHYMTTRQLRDLKKLPGFSKEAVDKVLEHGKPLFQNSTHLNRIRAISGLQAINDSRYEVWEYHGPIETADLEACGCTFNEGTPDEVEGVIWFCDNVVLKATVNPMDTDDRPYSVCYCAKDDTSIFGFGYPYMMRAAQAVACASWRMIIDNAGLSVGPQVVVDRRAIVPLDGDYKLRSRKVWDFIGEGEIKQSFMLFGIDAHVTELMTIFNTAIRLGDDETNLPQIAQGTQSPTITKTAQGMSILMNAANVVLRRAVKSYDDDITRTFIPRLYDWNMQFNNKPEIKGDFTIIARGSSVLMEKEQQTQSLLQALGLFANPQLAMWVDEGKFMENLMKNLRIDGSMRDPAAVEELKKQMSQQPQGPYKESAEYLNKLLEQQQKELDAKMEMHDKDTNLALEDIAAKAQMSVDSLRTKLGLGKLRLDAQQTWKNIEAALKARALGQKIQ